MSQFRMFFQRTEKAIFRDGRVNLTHSLASTLLHRQEIVGINFYIPLRNYRSNTRERIDLQRMKKKKQVLTRTRTRKKE